MLKKVLSIFALSLATVSFGFAEEPQEEIQKEIQEEAQEEVCVETCEEKADECQECSN